MNLKENSGRKENSIVFQCTIYPHWQINLGYFRKDYPNWLAWFTNRGIEIL